MKWGSFLCVAVAVPVLSFLPQGALAAVANITQAVFTTDIQSVDPAALSKTITVQLQNASGASESLDETADLSFVSSSATGEFSSSATSWKAVSTLTMSKGSANRSFYYKDSSAGTDTLAITVRSRDTGKVWTASQIIYVGTSPEPSPPDPAHADPDSGGTSSGSPAAPPAASSSSSSLSAHSDPEPLTSAKDTVGFSIGAGRDRLVSVGSPILFRANTKGAEQPSLEWSFGDGGRDGGEEVSHTYYFPGTYEVVLDADSASLHATARSRVLVVEPHFSLALQDGAVKLSNDSAYEMNLSGWTLRSDGVRFAIPRDTIMAAHSSIVFSPIVTHLLLPLSVYLDDPVGTTIASSGAPALPARAAPAAAPSPALAASTTEAVAAIEKKLAQLQSDWEAAADAETAPEAASAETASKPVAPAVLPPPDKAMQASDSPETQPAVAAVAASIPAGKSWWRSIRDFFIDLF